MNHQYPVFELCLPYKRAVTHHEDEEMVTNIAAYGRDHSDHYRSSEVAAL